PYASATAYRAAFGAPHPDVRIYAADAFIREQYFNNQYPHHHTEQQTATLGVNDAVATTTRSVGTGTVTRATVSKYIDAPQQLPENAIYYMGMSSGANYMRDPYLGGYADATYRPGGYTSYPTGTFYGPSHGYNQQYGTSYLHYPQPSPPNRRSRTAPSRTLPRGASGGSAQIANGVYPTATRTTARPRGVSVDAPVAYRAYLAPGKRPPAAYASAAARRSRVSSYHEGAGTLPGGYAVHTMTDYPFHTANRPINRTPSIYQPSYTSYPPAQMHFKERAAKEADPHRYSLACRCIVKGAQLLLGAAILGLVLGPMRSTSLVDFVTTTRTEWQGVVVGIVGTMTIATLLLLGTAVFAHKNSGWRKVDAHSSIVGVILYLLAACIEAYYAACYPPNGPRLNLVCHRPEWIIATILCFINVILYVIDFILSWMAG
ncbi:hypothetical protein PMAYCL1PPCAC_25358, partial [Pristionchus mayeri]